LKLNFLFFKKILSYLTDIRVDTASTALNPVLSLSLRKGRYYLTTTNAVYSFGDLYDNFSKTFQKIDFSTCRFKNILVLGFAMGSVPYMLEKVFRQSFRCTGVELDPKIVEWAMQYTIPTLTNQIKLLQADVLDFIGANQEKFDLIIVDIFLDDVIPNQFETLDFLQKTANSLTPNGLLLYNRLSDTPQALKLSLDFFRKNFLAVFPAGKYLDVSGNWMLANREAWV
jgi:predicted membrane-bound spermidine synthase